MTIESRRNSPAEMENATDVACSCRQDPGRDRTTRAQRDLLAKLPSLLSLLIASGQQDGMIG